MKLYDNPASANCMKCRIILRQLELPYESVEVDLFAGETLEAPHLARNPAGLVPVLELDDGTTIPESGAILLYLAEGTPLLPDDRLTRARVHQWMFFEQNRIEAELAVARFMIQSGRDALQPEATAHRVARGRNAMVALDRGLADGRDFLAGDAYTVADIAVYGYVHCAGDAGVPPREHPGVAAWLDRVEATPGFVNDMGAIPPHAMVR